MSAKILKTNSGMDLGVSQRTSVIYTSNLTNEKRKANAKGCNVSIFGLLNGKDKDREHELSSQKLDRTLVPWPH